MRPVLDLSAASKQRCRTDRVRRRAGCLTGSTDTRSAATWRDEPAAHAAHGTAERGDQSGRPRVSPARWTTRSSELRMSAVDRSAPPAAAESVASTASGDACWPGPLPVADPEAHPPVVGAAGTGGSAGRCDGSGTSGVSVGCAACLAVLPTSAPPGTCLARGPSVDADPGQPLIPSVPELLHPDTGPEMGKMLPRAARKRDISSAAEGSSAKVGTVIGGPAGRSRRSAATAAAAVTAVTAVAGGAGVGGAGFGGAGVGLAEGARAVSGPVVSATV